MESIKSMFDLYNRKETGLSRSLAAIIYSNYRVLKNNNINFNAIDIKTLEIYYELTIDKNRFDILCESDNFVIIFETKIGSSIVGDNQYKKYLNVLNKFKDKNKILIQVTQFGN